MLCLSRRYLYYWHPSSLTYATIQNPEDDFDSITSEEKSTAETRPDLYDCSLTSRRYALAGVACSTVFSISCIIAGIVIMSTSFGDNGAVIVHVPSSYSNLRTEMLALALNLIVTLCTESIGLVHSISLRSALASKSRLRFNTNLRLLTAARGWRNPNGTLFNGIMAVLLILSYTSASLVLFSMVLGDYDNTPQASIVDPIAIAGLPLLLLGVALFLQVVIALSGMLAVRILTWSSSPLDVTAALVHHMQLTPVPLRCMHCVSDVNVHRGPAKPLEVQPSAWHSHPSIRKVILSLWGLVVACAGWGALTTILWYINSLQFETDIGVKMELWWSFLPNPITNFGNISWNFPLAGVVTVQWWILLFTVVALVQGPLTLGLHCSELVANVIRDERCWRRATGRNELRMTTNPLKSFFTDPLSLVIFVTKSVLHWMFGLAYSVSLVSYYNDIFQARVAMSLDQIWNLCIALLIFACFFTVVALYRPRGPQPAAYGHLQTLANLVDEWSPVMWWGHKEDGIPYCHAGTSDHLVPPVKMDCIYAGSSVATSGPIHPSRD
ncbi:hypothetical protein K503DRAFT_855552 [Rhizopogon vinicolor AM-OR11-026]|uniref:Uncharacterized protein n=1 Tax=Rhizopogon vinicolor AM-OR11-026 TaxID=1314800 RepID=A0A1B7N5J7_9AGAM|nr:hypothetical protein K503DRAFT_855552 [Rhizopogon vinicolor AM-OR11-026]